MNFLHLSLLAGLGAMAIPVALHLLSRRQPKLVAFPALRFVKHTVSEQRGSWQLRHFLLLCLRVGMFGAMAIALARPRVHSAMLSTALGLSLVAAAAAFATLVALVSLVAKRGFRVWMPAATIAIALWLAAGIWTGLSLTGGPVVPTSDKSAPVAAAIVIDNGPSLDYRAENEKRFAAAKKMANWILGKLPLDSRVGVLSNAPLGALSLDPTTAQGQVELLQRQAQHVDLPARLRTAIDLVQATDLERKEVYIITDLVRSSWAGADAQLPALLKQAGQQVLVQIIDVGAERPTNWRLGDLEIETQSVPEGGDASWRVNVIRSASTPGASVTVELHHEEPGVPILSDDTLKTPPSRIVDRQLVDLTTATDAQVSLTARGLTGGTHNFQIKLTVADPLELDNVRYSTIVCAAQQSALVVSEDADAARLLRLALSPTASDPDLTDPSRIDPSRTDPQKGSGRDGRAETQNAALAPASVAQQVRASQLSQVDLNRYGVVYLNDPPSLPPATVNMLESFVKEGGGIFLALGGAIGTAQEAAQSPLTQLLPGKLKQVSTRPVADRSLFLVPATTTHPLFQIFGSVASEVPWNQFPLQRVWEFEELKPNVQVLMTTTDRALAAMVQERRGSGQIISFVTPLPSSAGANSWNELFAGADPWPAYGLIVGAARYLSGQSEAKSNFAAGETVSLPNDPKQYPSNYLLFAPNGGRRNVQEENGLLVLGPLEQAGTYRLRGLQGSTVTRGVSVNTPSDDTTLDRMSSNDLDGLLGEGNYRLARRQSDVESSVGQARYGRELFPILMAFIAALFLAEQAMSNRFYQLPLAPTRNR